MNIIGLNTKIIERLFELKLLNSFSDIYLLFKHKTIINWVRSFW